ncbi:MAG: hypothetical protein JWO78_176 [Micavibrio sp.]|nr:hypothetical protein [Micavibrio sp.]
MRNINEVLVDMLKADKELRLLHIKEAITSLMHGDTRTGLLMLRNLVNATCGFSELEKALGKNSKSLMRMLSLEGNPETDNIFKIINHLVEQEGWDIAVVGKQAA